MRFLRNEPIFAGRRAQPRSTRFSLACIGLLQLYVYIYSFQLCAFNSPISAIS